MTVGAVQDEARSEVDDEESGAPATCTLAAEDCGKVKEAILEEALASSRVPEAVAAAACLAPSANDDDDDAAAEEELLREWRCPVDAEAASLTRDVIFLLVLLLP